MGLPAAEADTIKGKNNLISRIMELGGTSKDMGDLVGEEPVDMKNFTVVPNEDSDLVFRDNETDIETEEIVPDSSSPEWNTYVLGLFRENELFEKNPKVNGLRRVVELLVGKIISSRAIVYQTPDPQFATRTTATVAHEIQVLDSDGQVLTYTEVSDAARFNTDDEYSLHLSAIASTRAEARALRKLLKIDAVAAEELTRKTVDDIPLDDMKKEDEEDFEFDKKMTLSQFNVLKLIAKRCDLNLVKYINSGSRTYTCFNDMPYNVVATKVIKHIQKFQQINPDTGVVYEVPEEYKGYNEEEVNNFWNQETK
jgi:hypothetical protein